MKLAETLKAIDDENGIETNGELGRFLGIDTRRVGEYINGKRTPTDDDIAKIATAARVNAGQLWEAIQMERKKDNEGKRAWENYMKSLGGIAAAVFITISGIVTGIMTSNPAEAAPVQASEPYALYYIKSKLRLCAKIAARLVCKICTFSPFSTRVRQMTA